MITLTAEITLANGEKITVNKRNMLSMDSKIIDRADINLPSWGIISNGGSIKIIDKIIDYVGIIKACIENYLINQDTKIEIFLQETLGGENLKTKLGEFFAEKWSYDGDTNIATINFSDGLTKLQDIQITPIPKNVVSDVGGAINAYDLFIRFKQETEKNGFGFEGLNSDTTNHLKKFTFAFLYIEAKSLWTAWQQFCEALQLHIYKNSNGKINCVYRGGD